MKGSLAVAVALSLGLGVSGLRAGEEAKPGADMVSRGQQVFAAQHCSMCHSVAGKGNPKTPLDDVGTRMKADEMKKYIANPKSVKADSKMKAYSRLSAEELDALVSYLQTLTKKGS